MLKVNSETRLKISTDVRNIFESSTCDERDQKIIEYLDSLSNEDEKQWAEIRISDENSFRTLNPTRL